jgi:hypothetical protein
MLVDRAEDSANAKRSDGRVEGICLDIESQTICQGLETRCKYDIKDIHNP